MPTMTSHVRNVSISGFKIFFQEAKDILNDLRDSGLPMEEEVRKPEDYSEYEHEGLIEIELSESKNNVNAVLITVVRAPDFLEPTLQRFEIKNDHSGSNTLCLILSITHPEFKETLRNEIETLLVT